MHRGGAGRWTLLAAAAVAAFALIAAVALAATGALTYKDCISNAGHHGCAAPTHDSLRGAGAVAVSPDGTSVYVASSQGQSITSFDRDPTSGALAYRGCIANAGLNGCAAPVHDSLAGARGVAVSPDGKSIYVASKLADSITRLDRDPTSGALTYADCIANAGANGCADPAHDSLWGPADVTVSPDGKSVYVASAPGDSITRLDRNTTSGALTYKDCIANAAEAGCTAPDLDSLGRADGVAVSPDGSTVYVASSTADSITRLNRKTTGALFYRNCIADGGKHGCHAADHDSLGGAEGVAVSPDGKSVYVASHDGDSITRLKASPTKGSLTYKDCIADAGANGCAAPHHDSLGGALGVAVSPDGESVYVASTGADSITRLNRHPTSGRLTYKGCIANAKANGCAHPGHDSLGGASGVAVSPEGNSVYVASYVDDSITSFDRAP
jgi:sugar lactone lactonase YvrE